MMPYRFLSYVLDFIDFKPSALCQLRHEHLTLTFRYDAQSIAQDAKGVYMFLGFAISLTSAVTAVAICPMAWADGLPVTTMIGVTSFPVTSAWIALSGLMSAKTSTPTSKRRIQGTTDMIGGKHACSRRYTLCILKNVSNHTRGPVD